MLGHIEAKLRHWRRYLNRSEWLARLLNLPITKASGSDTGLLLIQIDGLSYPQLERALDKGEMPFLKRLLQREHYQLHSLYTGVPSSTPAVQAELYYGIQAAVPGFGFMARESGELVRMYEPSAATRVEEKLKATGETPLLRGGSCYATNFCGGAAEAHFCPAEPGWGPHLREARKGVILLFILTHLWSFLRTGILLAVELVLAMADFIRGLIQGQDLLRELLFVPTRIAITILMRELITIGAKIDMARGLPIIHLNFLGYDEQSHRRGPDSAFAHWTLKGIDNAISRLWRASHRAVHRHYDVWIYSDHGQERTQPYKALYGRSFAEAAAEAIAQDCKQPVAYRATGSLGVQLQRVRLLGGNHIQRLFPLKNQDEATVNHPPLVISSGGPVAHLYYPNYADLDRSEKRHIAHLLVEKANAPLVLFKHSTDHVQGWWRNGAVQLPQDSIDILGTNHPFLQEASRDLINLCQHPDAGDFVICGWCEGIEPLSFATENGAHGGAAPRETHAFALLPVDIHAGGTATRRYWKTRDLRQAALRLLHPLPAGVTEFPRDRDSDRPLRLMTYNVHRCMGMDGKLSPERTARVIARHAPDIVALQELDMARARSGGVDQARLIARLLKMDYHFHPAIHLEEERFGDAILSRLPMRLVKADALPGLAWKSRFEPRGALWVAIEYQGKEIQVINTHLSLSAQERLLQINSLLGPEWLSHPGCREPHILCGDLNAGPRSATYRRLQFALRDVQTALRQQPAKPTFFGRMPQLRIDHIFTDTSLVVSAIEVPRTELVRTTSDHLPLIAALKYAID